MASRPVVIANTTPVINFAETGRLELLRQLFGEIVIPVAVADELKAKAQLFPLAAAASESPSVQVRPVVNPTLVTALRHELHAGEAECIALAIELQPSLLIMDDVAARGVAERRGLRITGSVGCLQLAKRLGFVPSVGPLLAELRDKARFWLSPRLIARVLRDAGESSV
jgi:predicted nucleic acid-binding protein